VNHHYGRLHDNEHILSFLREAKKADPGFTVLDIGASANPWTAGVLDATFDMFNNEAGGIHFRGNLNEVADWQPLLEYVDRMGKFSYAVCANTLEDLAYPKVVLDMLPRVAKAGFISVPSHYREMTRNIEEPWLGYMGYIHHRWMFRVVDGSLLLIPKMPLVEKLAAVEGCPADRTELRVFWEGEIKYGVLNGDYLGPSVGAVIEMYKQALS